MARKFRTSGRAVRQALMLAMRFGLPGAAMMLLGIYMILTPAASDARVKDPVLVFVGMAIILSSGIMMTLAAILLIVLTRSSLVVSPAGIEYRRWPLGTTSCRWSEVERITDGNVRGMAFTSLIYRPTGSAPETQVGVVRVMPLSDFDGWPSGDLGAEVRRYLPRLFETPE